MRLDHRLEDTLREVKITRGFTKYAEGSVLIEMGDTRVLCNASVLNKVPSFLQHQDSGWVTAEYSLLPRSTQTRCEREVSKGKASGRTQEIQRLIGRSLRAVVDLSLLGPRTIHLDCDVLQADGGTRCASITGAWVAMADAIDHLLAKGELTHNPIQSQVAAVSVGFYQGIGLLDLNYGEDSQCDSDINVIGTSAGQYIEIQGTAERQTFSRQGLNHLLDLADKGLAQLFAAQQASRL